MTTVEDILARMREDIRAQLASESEKVLTADREQLRQIGQQHEAARQKYEALAADAEAAARAASAAAARLESDREARRKGIDGLAASVARAARRVVTGALAVSVGASLVLGVKSSDSVSSRVAWTVGPLVLLIGGILSYLDNVHELSVKRLGIKFEMWVRHQVTDILLNRVDTSIESDSSQGPTSL